MNIKKASELFRKLLSETSVQPEIKVYKKFIAILLDLEDRNLTEPQLKSIEEKLETLGLDANPENRKKYFKKKLEIFTKFLKDALSLISEGYYTAIGLSLGLSFGVAFGAAFGNGLGLSNGLIIGMLVGLMIGAVMDSKAKKEGKVLRTKPI